MVEKPYVLAAILEYKDGRQREEELHRYATEAEGEEELNNLLAAFVASSAKLSRIEFKVVVEEEGINGARENRNVLSQVCWFN